MVFGRWDGVVLETVIEIRCADDCRCRCDGADELLRAYNFGRAEDGGIVGVLGDVNANFTEFGLRHILVLIYFTIFESFF